MALAARLFIPSEQVIEELAKYDTCILADAVERLGLRLHNRGFTQPGLRLFGKSPSSALVGYAVTARIRTAEPPITGRTFFKHTDWWESIRQAPAPRIVVIEDVDHHPGAGASMGMIAAALFKSLDCRAAITNGSVRDASAVAAMDFTFLADQLSPSHAYAHLVAHSCPVEIHGLTIQPGDLLAADEHGVVSIPADAVSKVRELAEELRKSKEHFVAFCQPESFSIEAMDNELRNLQL
ncbi:MAG: RraA family protein [Terriglobia bacterium]